MNSKIHLYTAVMTATCATSFAEMKYGAAGASDPSLGATSVTVYEKGVPGSARLDTVRITATVTAIDAETRKITIVGPAGEPRTFTAGPEVINFDQIKVGDQVTATLTSELITYLRKAGETEEAPEGLLLAGAAKGEKPAAILAGTVEITATIEAIDVENRTATLRLEDGSTKTIKVREDVDMTKGEVGDVVVIRATEAVALTVETPE